MTKFEPFHDRILILPAPPDRYRADLELLSNDIQDKNEGTVISVGHGVPLHNINLDVTGEVTEAAMDKLLQVVHLIEQGRKMKAKPGDYVLYGRHAGTKVTLDGVEHIIIREADIFGTLTEQTDGNNQA